MPRWSDDESTDAVWMEEETGYVDIVELINRIDLQLLLQQEFLTEGEQADESA